MTILEARRHRPAHLADTIGSLGRVYDFLTGRRPIAVKVTLCLAEFFEIEGSQVVNMKAELVGGAPRTE